MALDEMAAVSPAEQVISTAELLEAILSYLPMKDLLLAQAIGAKWKAVIDASPQLQRALFLQPATDKIAFFHGQLWMRQPQVKLDELENKEFFYLCNRSMTKKIEAYEESRAYSQRFANNATNLADPQIGKMVARRHVRIEQLKHDIRGDMKKTRIFMNPLLLKRFDWLDTFFLGERNRSTGFAMPDSDSYIDCSPSSRYPKASWRRMLITQPPLGMLATFERYESEQAHAWNSIDLAKIGTPITMQALCNTVTKHGGETIRFKGMEHPERYRSSDDLATVGKGTKYEFFQAIIESNKRKDGESVDQRPITGW